MALSISHRPQCVLSAWSEGGPTRPYVNRPDSVKRQNYSEQQRACRLQGNEKWILSFPYRNTKSHISKASLFFGLSKVESVCSQSCEFPPAGYHVLVSVPSYIAIGRYLVMFKCLLLQGFQMFFYGWQGFDQVWLRSCRGLLAHE